MVVGNLHRPLASKLCSHNAKPSTVGRLNTVGAKLARDGACTDTIASKLCSHRVGPGFDG